MLTVTEKDGTKRPAKDGDRFADRSGRVYVIFKGRELRVVRGSKPKTPGKAARKARRATELEARRLPVKSTEALL